MVKFRGYFENVRVVFGFIKKFKSFPVILTFFEISHNCFLLEKSWIMSMDNGTRLALGPWWTHDHGAARPHRGSGSHCDSSERERGVGYQSSHQWRHMEVKLRRWPHDSIQQRRPMVL
jgi:hypothetical protein